MVSFCKAFAKCTASKRKHVCVAIFLFAASLLCFFAIGPAYVGTLSTPVTQFADCGECGARYATYVLNEVNGTALVDKLLEEHDHHSKFHRGHHRRHHSHHDDVCITEDDVKTLDFHDVHFEPISRECIDTCAPIAQKAPLAAACALAMCICAIALLVASLGAFLCALCCKPAECSPYDKIDSMPSPADNSVNQPPVGKAVTHSDPLKVPLMPNKH